jgi:hypothetical protein
MAASTGLSNVLEDIFRVGREVESYLSKENSLKESTHGQTLDASEFAFPVALDGPRKQLANAAARLLQLATDPREYLEQLSANVSRPSVPCLLIDFC